MSDYAERDGQDESEYGRLKAENERLRAEVAESRGSAYKILTDAFPDAGIASSTRHAARIVVEELERLRAHIERLGKLFEASAAYHKDCVMCAGHAKIAKGDEKTITADCHSCAGTGKNGMGLCQVCGGKG